MTLNGVMAVTLRYFTEFGKPALQKTMCGGIYARDLYCVGGTLSLTQSIYCIFSECTMSSQRKFTFAISSPDEFLVLHWLEITTLRQLAVADTYTTSYSGSIDALSNVESICCGRNY